MVSVTVEELAARFRYYLGKADISQAELARRIGLKPPTISSWVHGVSAPTYDNICRACKEMGVDLAKFFGPLPENSVEAAS